MTSSEAAALDPQLRILLEVVYECLENSGIPIQTVAGSDTSCFVGSSSSGMFAATMKFQVVHLPFFSLHRIRRGHVG